MKKCLLNNIRLFFLLQEVEPCLGFGLTGLEALSAGIPILVSLKLGFGEALMKIPFGLLCGLVYTVWIYLQYYCIMCLLLSQNTQSFKSVATILTSPFSEEVWIILSLQGCLLIKTGHHHWFSFYHAVGEGGYNQWNYAELYNLISLVFLINH